MSENIILFPGVSAHKIDDTLLDNHRHIFDFGLAKNMSTAADWQALGPVERLYYLFEWCHHFTAANSSLLEIEVAVAIARSLACYGYKPQRTKTICARSEEGPERWAEGESRLWSNGRLLVNVRKHQPNRVVEYIPTFQDFRKPDEQSPIDIFKAEKQRQKLARQARAKKKRAAR